MRHFTLAAGLAMAMATAFAMTPAMAEMGGPVKDTNGMCRQFNGNSNNLFFYYWSSCPGTEPRKGGVGIRTIRATATAGHVTATHHKKHTS